VFGITERCSELRYDRTGSRARLSTRHRGGARVSFTPAAVRSRMRFSESFAYFEESRARSRSA
jgi:hypothetical protein